MKRAGSIFRRRLGLWLPPAILAVLGSFFLAREINLGRTLGGDLERRIAAATAERDAARADEARWRALTTAMGENRRDVAVLYGERFETEQGRFTDMIRELKRLAEHAGLDPREFGYPEETLPGYGIERRSFVFHVEGNYPNLRMFLHLLELSPSFVTVDQIKVGERAPQGLKVDLKLSTFFARPGAAEAAAEGRSPGPPPERGAS